jgi:hypothetical protein
MAPVKRRRWASAALPGRERQKVGSVVSSSNPCSTRAKKGSEALRRIYGRGQSAMLTEGRRSMMVAAPNTVPMSILICGQCILHRLLCPLLRKSWDEISFK